MDLDIKEWLGDFVPEEELRDMEFTDEDWLIKDLLVPGSYMVIYGKEGAGKSRLTYQLAQCFQSGDPWFGLNIGRTGPVLYLEMDMAPMESSIMLKDAWEAGYRAEGEIIFPKRRGYLDVLRKDGIEALEALRERFNPLVVVIDTITDVYLSDGKSSDVNEEIRRVINVFREVFPDAGLIFLLHKRKASQFLQSKGIKDEGAVLGPGETTRKASAVIEIQKVNAIMKNIIIDKSRQAKPFEKLTVFTSEEDRGFCRVDLSYVSDARQALALWPHLRGLDPEGVAEVTSIRGVCVSIEELSGGKLKADSVRKAYTRAKQRKVVFHWEKLFAGDSGDIGVFGDK